MTTLYLANLLSAAMLLAGDPRSVADDAVQQAVAAAAPRPALPGARDQDGLSPRKGPAQGADRRPGAEVDQVNAPPPVPEANIDTLPNPFRQPGRPSISLRPAQGGPTLAMPPNPFPVVPPGATALRKAAVYGMQVGPAPAVGGVGGVGGEKAFASYRPTSPISPYMGLYAPRTLGVDNYNAYVRPQLQQQAFNQQVDATFRGLETDRAQQEAASQGLEQPYTVGPGASGATFMNLQPYYPSHPSAR